MDVVHLAASIIVVFAVVVVVSWINWRVVLILLLVLIVPPAIIAAAFGYFGDLCPSLDDASGVFLFSVCRHTRDRVYRWHPGKETRSKKSRTQAETEEAIL
jgi:hypothetical protein